MFFLALVLVSVKTLGLVVAGKMIVGSVVYAGPVKQKPIYVHPNYAKNVVLLHVDVDGVANYIGLKLISNCEVKVTN